MKSYLFSMMALMVTAGHSFAQKRTTPPPSVKDAFEKKFTGITKLHWSKEGKTGFEASFIRDNTAMSAVYDATGRLQETETAIAVNALPAPVIEYLQLHYKGSKIKETAKITKAGGVVNYEAEVNGRDLLFDETGAFIKSVKD